jgi:hypothetical protein
LRLPHYAASRPPSIMLFMLVAADSYMSPTLAILQRNFPKRSPTTGTRNKKPIYQTSEVMPHVSHQKITCLENCTQQARNHFLRQYSRNGTAATSSQQVKFTGGPTSAVCSPKRKQLALLQDEEQRCILDDRAGTLHISEIWHEDVVNTYSNIMGMDLGTT